MLARLIVNPMAGGNSAMEALTHVNLRLRGKYPDMDIVMTTGPGDAGRAAGEAAAAGCRQRRRVTAEEGTR